MKKTPGTPRFRALLATVTLSLGFLFASNLEAQLLLSMDFNTMPAGGSASPTESGYTGVVVNNAEFTGPFTTSFTGLSTSLSSGTVGLTIAAGTTLTSTGAMLSRDRPATTADNGSFTYQDLYRDFIISKYTTGGIPKMTIGLSGLNASTEYLVTFYAYDNNNSGAISLQNTTGTGSQSGSISWTAGYAFNGANANENAKFSTTLRVQTDTLGNLTFINTTTSGAGFQGILNGIQVTAVPEPTAIALVIAGCGILFLRRRHRH